MVAPVVGMEYHAPMVVERTISRARWPGLLTLIIGLLLAGLGLFLGEPQSYFMQAINICTQCIGIG